MVLFTASLISGSTSLPEIVDTLAHREIGIYPSLAFAGVAFTMVSLAENARIPVDNPATHLELTMIHEAMLLEYSARHLALIEWAAALKLFNYSCIGLALFVPCGIVVERRRLARAAVGGAAARRQARGRRRGARAARDAVGEDAHLPRAGVPRHGVHARRARDAGQPAARRLSHDRPCRSSRSSSTCWRRSCCCSRSPCSRSGACVSLIDLFAAQGLALACSTAIVGLRDRPAAPVLLGRAHAGAQGIAAAVAPAPPDAPARRAWDVEGLINMPTTMIVGLVLVVFSFNLAVPISQLGEHRHARDARHRDGHRDAVVPDDDHAAQGDPAGDRLPVDGERPVLRRDQRHLRHADGGRARHRARRAGRRC